MSSPSHRALVKSVARHVERSHAARQRAVQLAVVRDVSPLTVELTEHRMVISEDDVLTVTANVREYDKRHGLVVGDSLVLSPLRSQEFIAWDVVTASDMDRGLDVAETAVTVSTPNGTVVATIPYVDSAGVQVGVIPIYDEATLVSSLMHASPATPPGSADPGVSVTGTADLVSGAVTGTGTMSDNITRKIPIYAADGTTVLGYVPVYGTLP